MDRSANDAVARMVALRHEVEREFDEIRGRHASSIACRAGCNACCRARLSIPLVEAEMLADALRGLPRERRRELARRADDPAREMCPALDDDGTCGVYEHRPLICRSFGVPARRRGPVAIVDPPKFDVCDLNFVGVRLDRLEERDVLDQTALDREVARIDADHGGSPDERVPIAAVLRGLVDAE